MNLSFTLQGLLIAGGAVLIWNRTRGKRKLTLALLTVCGVGVIVVGAVPENTDVRVHEIGAAMHLLGGGLGIITAGFSLRRRLGWGSVALGTMVVIATALLLHPDGVIPNAFGVGTVERVAAYGITVWMTFVGFMMSRHGCRRIPT